MKASVQSTTKSYAMATTGTPLQPSVQGAVLQAIPTESGCPNTVKALTAICLGLLEETHNPDSMSLAMSRAEAHAQVAGISAEEFNQVRHAVLDQWKVSWKRNPLSCLF